jgi:perosamine synthetase
MNRKIAVAEPVLDGREAEYVMDCIQETWISSQGKYIQRFEKMLADYCGVKSAVVTNNGTTALHLALVACGIEPGDEVILPTLTYVASANAIRYCNATPVFVDSEPQYLSIDPQQIEQAITPRTKAILTVPLYGHPVDYDPIASIADRHGLMVIEDSAEALGAQYRGRPIGSLARCSTFSFFGNKLITTGEGGAIVTDDEQLAERMKFLRGQGVDPKKRYWHPEIGFNYRMTNVAAAIGVAQMERIDELLGRRQQVAEWYFKYLEPCQDMLQLPFSADWATHSYWMFTVMLNPDLGVDRDAWMESLAKEGIETRPVFYPVHTMPAYQNGEGNFPIAETCSALGINLPTHGKLSQLDVRYICDKVISTLEALRRRVPVQQQRAA